MGSSVNLLLMTVGLLITSAAIAFAMRAVLGHGSTPPLQHFQHKFAIDYEKNVFLMDSKPFRYVSGSFHYFRAVPEVWRNRLRTMRACGLNTVDTYIEWSLHNPKDGVYNFEGIADVENFIKIAQAEGLYVILRPGPYICAERDNGGLPYWLFTKYPGIKPRTSDTNYTNEVSIWYKVIMKKMQKYLYGNGGPIIMVQVENEYGSFDACDKNYLNWLRDETKKYVHSNNAVLFTTDIPNDRISCGKIDDVFATTDFGLEKISSIDDIWSTLRSVQPNGPLVNSEFYPGWLTHWQEENQRRDGVAVAEALRNILSYGANVNIYMFFGGTNFGFSAGANDWGFGNYTPDITSYDYDAVMDEAGDPTPKYMNIRDVLKEFVVMPTMEIPEKSLKSTYGSIELKPITDVLSEIGLDALSVKHVVDTLPKSFEELDQYSGLVLYETNLPKLEIDPTLLTVNDLRDRALVYIDGQLIGTLSRQNQINSLPLNAGAGEKLQLLVENQGRINFNVANDTKGIFGPITIQQLSGNQTELFDWSSKSLPLESEQIQILLNNQSIISNNSQQRGILWNGPAVFHGVLNVSGEPTDTYLNTEGWGKGVVYINGFNLGRYWPLVGPQITLYVPGPVLRSGPNDIVLLELQKTSSDLRISFTDTARLDGE